MDQCIFSFQQTRVGVVKSTNHQDIQVQPFETVTLSGFVRKDKNVETVVTEQTQGASTRIGFVPGLFLLTKLVKEKEFQSAFLICLPKY